MSMNLSKTINFDISITSKLEAKRSQSPQVSLPAIHSVSEHLPPIFSFLSFSDDEGTAET